MFKDGGAQNVNIFFFCAENEEAYKFMPKNYILYLMIPMIEVLSMPELSWNPVCPSGKLVTC